MSDIETIKTLNRMKQDIRQRTQMINYMPFGDYVKDRMGKQGREECDALDAAILALNRRAPDTGNPETENKPLTLEELRGMDGCPVWCHGMGEWGMVCVNHENGFIRLYTPFNTASAEHVCNNDGRIFRRKPESKEEAE